MSDRMDDIRAAVEVHEIGIDRYDAAFLLARVSAAERLAEAARNAVANWGFISACDALEDALAEWERGSQGEPTRRSGKP